MALTKIKTSGIADNAITNAKMADDAIDSADFVDGSIDNAHLADDAVNSDEIAAGAIDLAHMSVNSIDSDQYVDGSIDNVHLAGSIAVSKTVLAGGTGLTLSTNTLAVDAAQTQITSVGTLTSLTGGTGDLIWDTPTFVVDSSANGVGIGTTSMATVAGATDLTVGNTSGAHGITILSQGNSVGNIFFAEAVGTVSGKIEYSNDIQDMFFTAGSSRRMTINSTGVGIGTESPSAKLHIQGTDNADAIEFTYASENLVHSIFTNFDDNTAANNRMIFKLCDTSDAGQTTVMTLLGDGNVGIGLTDPDAKLVVNGATKFGNQYSMYAGGAGFEADDLIGYVGAQGDIGDQGLSTADFIIKAKGSFGIATNNTNGAQLSINTSGNATFGSTASEGSLKIFGTNNVHIRLASYGADGSQGHFLRSWGTFNTQFFEIGSRWGGDTVRLGIANDGTLSGSSSADISDRELKKNIKSITNGLDTINQLEGRTFDWKVDAKMQEGTQYGLIAQELEEVLPDLVYDKHGIRKKEDGSYYKSIQMTGVIPVLIEAVKELSAKVTALENA